MRNQLCALICVLTTSAIAAYTFRDSGGIYDTTSSVRTAERSVLSASARFAEWSTQISTIPNNSIDGASLTLTAGEHNMTLLLRNDGPRPVKVWAMGSDRKPKLTLDDMNAVLWNLGNPLGGHKWCGTGLAGGYVSLEPGQSYQRKLSYAGAECWWRRDFANQIQARVGLHGDELYSNPVALPEKRYRNLQEIAAARPPEDSNEDDGVVKSKQQIVEKL